MTQPEEVPVLKEDLWPMVMSTVRYMMGRRSGSTGWALDIIVRYSKHLTTQQINQIYAEVDEELRKYEAFGGVLGDKSDHEAWKKFIEARKRSSDGPRVES